MRDDFCAFILTHGRADRVLTYDTLKRCGYTGKIYIVIDDEDGQADQYRAKYGDKVLQFSKAEIASQFDEGDNFNDRRAIIYARNACWNLARQVGCQYFIQLDDDYTNFAFRFDAKGCGTYAKINNQLDSVLESLVAFLDVSNQCLTISMSQGGDTIGGTKGQAPTLKRKAMNSFVCSLDKKFSFIGRINEDVNTYTTKTRQGEVFFMSTAVQLVQVNTQQNKGGMAELYFDSGTYVKSFYTVMYCPSSVKISEFGDAGRWGAARKRLHHRINWNATAPKIIREKHRKRNLSNATQAA